MVKKFSLAAIAAFSLMSAAQAETHSLSAGYAYQEVKHFNHFAGLNLKYRYEFNERYGLISSFSFISGSDPYPVMTGQGNVKNTLKVKTLSLLTGPVYRINRHVSLYGLVGANRGKISYFPSRENLAAGRDISDEELRGMRRTTSFAWGGGLQINPLDYLVIDLGYEGTRPSVDGQRYTMSGFNIGVGYSF